MSFIHAESREVPKSNCDMGMPPETDKVWLYTGEIVYSCDIQSTPHESEFINSQILESIVLFYRLYLLFCFFVFTILYKYIIIPLS